MPRARAMPAPPVYTFRVRLRGFVDEEGNKTEDVWREIEIAANQTLEDLGQAIPAAFEFWDAHLWSFFMSGKAWDESTEYALQDTSDSFSHRQSRLAKRVRIGGLDLPGKTGRKEFLFLFDYGDDWHFGVKLVRMADAVEPGATYPRVVAQQGEAPPQYEDEEDDEEEEEENNEGEKADEETGGS